MNNLSYFLQKCKLGLKFSFDKYINKYGKAIDGKAGHKGPTWYWAILLWNQYQLQNNK